MASSPRKRLLLAAAGVVLAVAVWFGWPRSQRAPFPLPHDFARSAHALLVDIYTGMEGAMELPIDAIRLEVVRLGVGSYLDDLPLEPALAARLKEHLGDPRAAATLVPFVLALRDQYDAPEVVDFAQQLAGQPELRALPGAEHALFSWEPADDQGSDASEGDAGFSERLAVLALGFYDSVFIQDDFWQSHLLPERYQRLGEADHALIERTRPLVVELLLEAAGNLEEGEVRSAIEQLAHNQERSEAITISAIDGLRGFVLKHTRSFGLGLLRRQSLRAWLEARYNEELQSQQEGPLIAYLQGANRDRRYAVQIVVDGLQAELLRSLSGATPDSAFLRQALKSSRPSFTASPAGARPIAGHGGLAFLEYLVAGGETPTNYLPFFRQLFANGAVVGTPAATTPTISIRNLPLVFTGAPVAGPGGTGIPNFHFVERSTDRAYYFYGNDFLLVDELTAAQGMRSMFERLQAFRTVAYFPHYDWHSQKSYESLLNLVVGEHVRDFGERAALADLERRAVVERSLRATRGQLINLLREHKQTAGYDLVSKLGLERRVAQLLDELAEQEDAGLPEFALLYNPWPDHYAHPFGPFSDEVVSSSGELARLDYWLRRVDEVYRDAGIYSRTLFGMAGDHGLVPVHRSINPETVVLAALGQERGQEILVHKISSDEGEGPKLTHVLRPPSNRGYDAIVASTAGGNYMLDLFADQAEDWTRQPLAGELQSWTPLAGGAAIDIVDELAQRLDGSLEYLAVREAPCSPERATVRLVATREGARVDELIERTGSRIFVASSAADLLGLRRENPWRGPLQQAERERWARLLERCLEQPQRDEPESWADEDSWRELCSYTERPDSVVQLAHLYDLDRAGTINLFPLLGWGYNSLVPGRHAGESFPEKDAFLGFWGGPVRQHTMRPAVIGSLAPTLFEYLTGTRVEAGRDGWGFPSLLPEVLESP